MQVDHIESVYRCSGANDIENYNPACRMCNFYKSTMSVEDFREQLGKLLSRLEKVFIFRLAKKYGLIREIVEPVIFYFEKRGLEKVVDFEREKLSRQEKEVEEFEKNNNVKNLFVDYQVNDECRNPNTYGSICLKCGRCGRTFTQDGFLKE